MKKYFFLFLVIFLCSNSGKGQSNYLVGTSNVSIEPDNSIFSLSLADYGAPRDGRFSISWKQIDQTPELTAIAGLNGKFYGATCYGYHHRKN